MHLNIVVFKKNYFWLAVVLFSLALPSSYAAAATWTQYYMVTDVYPTANGDVYFKQETQENPDNCNSINWYRMKSDYATRAETYALVLTSMALGHKVRFSLNGCEGDQPGFNAVIMDSNQ